ncbi:MAG: hypothetical protein A4S14_00350 [Proteobacteria bacterium SG_bin9]|nr:MAG: hypothetical protein A4S14_00350 [Proteobacteria bacterium SG_bin9]
MTEARREGFESFKRSNQTIIDRARSSQRKGAIDSLNSSWSGFCDASTREQRIDSVRHYYWHRQNLIRVASNSWGQEGRQFALGMYQTAEDSQIDRMSQHLFSAGYLKVDDFRPATHEMFAEIVKAERVRGNPCGS